MTGVKIPLKLKSQSLPITTQKTLKISKTPLIYKLKSSPKLRQIQFIGQLHDFQTSVIEWTNSVSGGLIDLDMGLGKTAITWKIISHKLYDLTLIVVPPSLLSQWLSEGLKFTDLLPHEICIYHGPKRHQVIFEKCRVILTSFHVIQKDLNISSSPLYQIRSRLSCLVIDEAHKIRNHKTLAYQSCYELGQYCQAKWLLSGTIIHNTIDDFMTLAEFLNTPDFHKIQQNSILFQEWKDTYHYRLTKAECILPLPNKYLYEHFLEFDDGHTDEYLQVLTEVKDIYKSYLNPAKPLKFSCLLSKILRLRQCCNHPNAILTQSDIKYEQNLYSNPYSAKFQRGIKLISETPIGDKIVIFSQWKHTLDLFSVCLKLNSITYLEYNGLMNLNQKNHIVNQFQIGSHKVLLLTTTAGGVGLNLNFANHVILLDSWWNSAVEEQAIDRTYRLGQIKDVYVHRLYMKDTIEEWLIEFKNQKKMINDNFHQEIDENDLDCDNYQILKSDKTMLTQLLHNFI